MMLIYCRHTYSVLCIEWTTPYAFLSSIESTVSRSFLGGGCFRLVISDDGVTCINPSTNTNPLKKHSWASSFASHPRTVSASYNNWYNIISSTQISASTPTGPPQFSTCAHVIFVLRAHDLQFILSKESHASVSSFSRLALEAYIKREENKVKRHKRAALPRFRY